MPWQPKEYSRVLDMEFSFHNEDIKIMTADKVVYNKQELAIILETGLDKNIHNFKKVFKGEIIESI